GNRNKCTTMAGEELMTSPISSTTLTCKVTLPRGGWLMTILVLCVSCITSPLSKYCKVWYSPNCGLTATTMGRSFWAAAILDSARGLMRVTSKSPAAAGKARLGAAAEGPPTAAELGDKVFKVGSAT